MNLDFFESEDTTSLPDQNEKKDSTYIWGSDLSYIASPNIKKAKRKNFKVALLRAMVIVVAFLVCLSVILTQVLGRGWLGNLISNKANINITIPIQSKPKLEANFFNETTGEYTAEGIAKTVLPSVVSIVIYEKGVSFVPSSQGSGIILTENGYIITNAHVVENATRAIKVILNNDEEYEAKIVGSDKKTDLAVIKINAKGLTTATLGNSDELKIGEEIIALGSPAGLFGSLTKGVVSGLDRMIKTEATNLEMNCIQIDAAINPGNSGGALVNMYGQVVGINSSKFISDTYDGIGFAISINAAKPILEGLIADGYIKNRIKVGILFYEITEEAAKIDNTKAGFLIKEIDPTCDIAKSGLQVNDIITHVNGLPVVLRADVDAIVKGKKPGDEVTATVFRPNPSGEPTTFEIKFKLMEDTSKDIVSSGSN